MISSRVALTTVALVVSLTVSEPSRSATCGDCTFPLCTSGAVCGTKKVNTECTPNFPGQFCGVCQTCTFFGRCCSCQAPVVTNLTCKLSKISGNIVGYVVEGDVSPAASGTAVTMQLPYLEEAGADDPFLENKVKVKNNKIKFPINPTASTTPKPGDQIGIGVGAGTIVLATCVLDVGGSAPLASTIEVEPFTSDTPYVCPCPPGATCICDPTLAAYAPALAEVRLFKAPSATGFPGTGVPLIGSILLPTQFLVGTSPATFSISKSAVGAITSSVATPGMLPQILTQKSTVATLGNGPGSFFSGGGAGNVSFTATGLNASGAPRVGNVQITSGPNQFGGTMQILGGTTEFLGFQITPSAGILEGAVPRNVRALGVSNGFRTTAMGTFFHTSFPSTTPVTVTATGFLWTTGTVVVGKATSMGGTSSQLSLAGYDNRTAQGLSGTIQLVAPGLWQVSGLVQETRPFIASAKFTFVPEPGRTALLSFGLILLAAIYRRRR